jgi:hypothetical protein
MNHDDAEQQAEAQQIYEEELADASPAVWWEDMKEGLDPDVLDAYDRVVAAGVTPATLLEHLKNLHYASRALPVNRARALKLAKSLRKVADDLVASYLDFIALRSVRVLMTESDKRYDLFDGLSECAKRLEAMAREIHRRPRASLQKAKEDLFVDAEREKRPGLALNKDLAVLIRGMTASRRHSTAAQAMLASRVRKRRGMKPKRVVRVTKPRGKPQKMKGERRLPAGLLEAGFSVRKAP